MHVAVVANGDLPDGTEEAVANVLRSADLVIAADGGLRHCYRLGIWPDALVGDLDSAPVDLVQLARKQGVHVRAHPRDKDATDLELALDDAMEAGAASIIVVAPFGGRLDHELATVGLLGADRWSSIAMAATDGRRQLWVIRTALELDLQIDATLSLVPWATDVAGVSTTGLKWPLAGEDLRFGTTRGVSNTVVAPAQSVTIASGLLLAITDTESADA